MHLIIILAFAILFWEAEQPGRWTLVSSVDVPITITVALMIPVLTGVAAAWMGRRGVRIARNDQGHADDAHGMQHRATTVLNVVALVGFAGLVFLTPWPEWFRFGNTSAVLQIAGHWLVLAPFAISVLLVWVATYQLERALRILDLKQWEPMATPVEIWSLRGYLDFHLRHYLLAVGVPMSMILFVADLVRANHEALRGRLGIPWISEVAVGAVAVVVYLFSPVILRHIWRTERLAGGTVRTQLEALCRRIGLRCRDILVWKSDGMMINAAVMGLVAPMRYVLLSDALLSAMNAQQIQAVFGHEAGHIRRRHVQHFLIFAFAGWAIIASIMELLAMGAIRFGFSSTISLAAIQGFGIVASLLFWGIGFGILSRRFERQADLFGARCAAPEARDCQMPCTVHGEGSESPADKDNVCATGAMVFASALDRVAVLNGIPHEEPSWRHASIGSRIRFLMSAADDPARAREFERKTRRLQRMMLGAAVIGAAVMVAYWAVVPEPAILRLQEHVVDRSIISPG